MRNENQVVAVLNTAEPSSTEFLIRDEQCLTTHTRTHKHARTHRHTHTSHTGEKLFTIDDHLHSYSLRFLGIAGENLPFIYLNDTSKLLAE